MWNLIKAEFTYNVYIYATLLLLFLTYTVFALFNYELLRAEYFGVDYWGGFLAGILYLFYFIMWPIRIKELREKQNVVLPLSLKQIALGNTLYIAIPVLFTLVYFLIFHISILSLWEEQTASIVTQLGSFFTVFTAFIFIRQLKLLMLDKKMLIQFATISAAILYMIIFIAATFLILKQISYDLFGWYYGRIIFYLPVFINLFLAYKFFLKRKSYIT